MQPKTKDRAVRFERGMCLNKDDKPLSVESTDMAKHGPDKGRSVCKAVKMGPPVPANPDWH